MKTTAAGVVFLAKDTGRCLLQLREGTKRFNHTWGFWGGIIEKGETQHGEAIGNALMKSLLDIQINQNKPIGLGVIGPGTEPHHITSRIKKHAKGAVSAICALL